MICKKKIGYKERKIKMIGTRGHDIAENVSAEVLASQMEKAGFKTVQLVAYKSIEGVADQGGHLSSAKAFEIGQAFKKHNIHIGLIGSYFNFLDEATVEQGIERFKEYLIHGREIGGYLVGTETGSYKKDWTYHPDNHSEEAYQKVLSIFRELLDVAKNHGMCIGVEGAYHHTMGTPRRVKRLIDDLDATNVRVILDPFNFLHIGNYTECKQIIQEAFELYGDRIEVFHAKDFIVENEKMIQVPLGTGLMDYPWIYKIIRKYKPGLDIIIEGQTGDGLIQSRKFLEKTYIFGENEV